jgi:hypothetical protein
MGGIMSSLADINSSINRKGDEICNKLNEVINALNKKSNISYRVYLNDVTGIERGMLDAIVGNNLYLGDVTILNGKKYIIKKIEKEVTDWGILAHIYMDRLE